MSTPSRAAWEACSKDEAAAGAVAANPELVATLGRRLPILRSCAGRCAASRSREPREQTNDRGAGRRSFARRSPIKAPAFRFRPVASPACRFALGPAGRASTGLVRGQPGAHAATTPHASPPCSNASRPTRSACDAVPRKSRNELCRLIAATSDDYRAHLVHAQQCSGDCPAAGTPGAPVVDIPASGPMRLVAIRDPGSSV